MVKLLRHHCTTIRGSIDDSIYIYEVVQNKYICIMCFQILRLAYSYFAMLQEVDDQWMIHTSPIFNTLGTVKQQSTRKTIYICFKQYESVSKNNSANNFKQNFAFICFCNSNFFGIYFSPEYCWNTRSFKTPRKEINTRQPANRFHFQW